MRTFTRFALAITALMMLQACVHSPSDGAGVLRQTAFGPVTGSHDASSGVYSWKGIPFAAAPAGDLRWKAPVDPQPWTAPRAATAFAPDPGASPS